MDTDCRRTMGGLCSFMGARVMAHTSLECTCLEKGRPAARRRKSARCSGSSLLVPSSRLWGTFSAASPACSSSPHLADRRMEALIDSPSCRLSRVLPRIAFAGTVFDGHTFGKHRCACTQPLQATVVMLTGDAM